MLGLLAFGSIVLDGFIAACASSVAVEPLSSVGFPLVTRSQSLPTSHQSLPLNTPAKRIHVRAIFSSPEDHFERIIDVVRKLQQLVLDS
jgi:hypothetical protein